MEVLECFFPFFGDLVVGLLELLLEVGIDSAAAGRRKDRDGTIHEPGMATVGYLFLGGIVGALSGWLLPQRLLGPPTIPGLSLVVSPLIAGGGMYLWGEHRRGHGHKTTSLATFHGGAAFAFGVALVRFVLVVE